MDYLSSDVTMINLRTVVLLILYSTELLCVKTKVECGYKQCPQTRDGALNVHLIPHSHMDAGWVKTFDEYYYGTRTTISSANVQLIYHSVLSELLHDKRRKFTFSETAYFWRWWKEQRPPTRATFRSLVQDGRVEFAGGGWTHADSATISYLQALDLWTWGLRKLNDTLGPCGKPKAAWQIDAYGHTREQTSLFAQMGFDGLFLGRVDYKEREAMMEEDRMEFMWRGSDVLGKMSDIMTHNLYNLYNAPNGFCFDWLCGDEPIVDDTESPTFNAGTRVNEFIAQIERQAKYYEHDNIMVTMGGDFTYQNAANWFMNMDKLINHINTHPANMSDLNIFYSTPSCFLKAIYLYGRRDKALFTEKGDYLPYGSDQYTYWTGFYTSRPSLKYFARRAHVFLQVLKQLSVLARSGDSYELHLLRHAEGLILHHDAITGTSQQHVANDFMRTLSEAVDICSKKISTLLSYLTPTWGGSRRSKNGQQFVVCYELNISQCHFVETQESLLVLVYNPLSIKTYHYVRLPAIALHYSIRDFNDEEVEYQLTSLPAAMINLPGRSSSAIQEVWFEAENIPPLGYAAYYIVPVRDQLEENNQKKAIKSSLEAEQESLPYISNEYLKVTVDKTTGLLESIQHVDGVKIQVSQNFHVYRQMRQRLQSGGYSFRPQQETPGAVTEKVQYNTVRGSLVKEIRQRFTDWISQVIRIYRGEEIVELEWIVGPVPIGSDLGKEVVSIFKTNISTNGEFHTDSNGRQMMKRTCWNETTVHRQKKPVAACYYPVTSRICINSLNSSTAMCVLTDRTQGGTSYADGEIELMVHRRLLTDDGFGLEEPLNEEAFGVGLVVKGTHRIVFGNPKLNVDDLTHSERVSRAARRWEMEPWLFFTSGDKVNRRKWQNVRNKRFSGLRPHGLPAHIQVLTLEPWRTGSVLLRLENTLETADRGRYPSEREVPEDTSSHITVDLRKIFIQLKIRTVRETTLGANQWLDDARQMDWSSRYVYNGGDDGLLPDDVPEEENKSTKNLENNSAHYSEEDTENTRKYHRKKKIPISKGDRYHDRTRQKRSTNETFNINDNIINETLKETPTSLNLQEDTELSHLNIPYTTTADLNNVSKTTQNPKKLRLRPKLSFRNKSVLPKGRLPYLEVDDDVIRSSEEDFSSNMRKRSPRKKNVKVVKKVKDDIVIDNSDDGITKSMYEMYYKPRVPKNPFKKPKSHEVKVLRRQKSRPVEESAEVPQRSTRRKKKVKYGVDMPVLVTRRPMTERERYLDTEKDIPLHEENYSPRRLKRRGVQSTTRRIVHTQRTVEDSDYEDDDEEYDSDEESRRRRSWNRRKRTLLADEPSENLSEDQNDLEYKITLRPTQIRTFVVWFVTDKKTFVI